MTDQVLAEQRIGQNTEVTLHFALRLENGDTVDSTFDKAPATFTVGDGNLLPGFEQALFGLEKIERAQLVVRTEVAPIGALGAGGPSLGCGQCAVSSDAAIRIAPAVG